MSSWNLVFSWVEHEKKFYNLEVWAGELESSWQHTPQTEYSCNESDLSKATFSCKAYFLWSNLLQNIGFIFWWGITVKTPTIIDYDILLWFKHAVKSLQQ